MEKKIERLNGELVISFVANGEEWANAQKKQFNKLAAKLNVPGFRKGKVPANIAKGRINPAEVLHEAMFAIVNKEYAEVIQEEKIAQFSQPGLEVNKVSETELECVVRVALPPVVKLGAYTGIEVELEEVSVSEEDVNAAINKKLNENATLMLKEGEAALGDTVVIDFKGYVDNIPFEGGEAKAYELKLGSNSFIPGFEDQLVGIKAGELRTVTVTFPENYIENLASKEATFDCLCHDVKETILPALDDEFVKELNIAGIETVEAYKEKLSQDILNEKTRNANNVRLEKIINTAVDNAEVELADSIVTEEAKAQIENIKKQVESNGLKFEDYLKVNNVDEAQFLEARKAEAAHNLKGMLVIEEICRKENIVVDSKALNTKYEELAKMYNMKIEDVRKALEPQKNELLRNLRNELFTKFMLANNSKKEETVEE